MLTKEEDPPQTDTENTPARSKKHPLNNPNPNNKSAVIYGKTPQFLLPTAVNSHPSLLVLARYMYKPKPTMLWESLPFHKQEPETFDKKYGAQAFI